MAPVLSDRAGRPRLIRGLDHYCAAASRGLRVAAVVVRAAHPAAGLFRVSPLFALCPAGGDAATDRCRDRVRDLAWCKPRGRRDRPPPLSRMAGEGDLPTDRLMGKNNAGRA